MIYTHSIDGLPIKTGDILCTSDGTEADWFGRVWRWIGYLVPGRIDHTILYVGPGGRCIEAGGRGVIDFTMPGPRWQAEPVADQRLLADTLVGVAYPLQSLNLSPAEEQRIRTTVATYCLAQIGKPYNANFLNTVTDDAFYCSQLIYLAYRAAGVDLSQTPVRLVLDSTNDEETPLLVLPTALLENCPHQLVRSSSRLRPLPGRARESSADQNQS
ncbi:MAG: YiiX/YebB-like N1pC/P60 family cysteine hydrolase [Caldilineaceae bacterium]